MLTFASLNMVVVAQLVRALVCGAEGRGFEPHHPPVYKSSPEWAAFLLYMVEWLHLFSLVVVRCSDEKKCSLKKIELRRYIIFLRFEPVTGGGSSF
jgi:hypothetical protein